MTESFMQKKKKRNAGEEQKGEILFGLLGGFVLLTYGIMNNLPINGAFGYLDIISLGLSCIGVGLLLLGFVAPALLRWPYKGFVYIGKKAGSVILIIILAVVYVFMILPIGLLIRKKRTGYGFFTWEEDFPYQEKVFTQIEDSGSKGIEKTIKLSFLRNIYRLFHTLIRHKTAYLVPAVIVLVIVGMILFFAASNVFLNFFIYTLF